MFSNLEQKRLSLLGEEVLWSKICKSSKMVTHKVVNH